MMPCCLIDVVGFPSAMTKFCYNMHGYNMWLIVVGSEIPLIHHCNSDVILIGQNAYLYFISYTIANMS